MLEIDLERLRRFSREQGLRRLAGRNGEYLFQWAWMPREFIFSHSDLAAANLKGFCLINAMLGRANLSQADFTNANLTGANLIGANLSGANLTRAKLGNALLNHANLINAKLSFADLDGADLTGATMPDGMTYDSSYP